MNLSDDEMVELIYNIKCMSRIQLLRSEPRVDLLNVWKRHSDNCIV